MKLSKKNNYLLKRKKNINNNARTNVFNIIVATSLLCALLFGIVTFFYNKIDSINSFTTVSYIGCNTYLINTHIYQILFFFNPFAITMTIFISFSILFNLYKWLDNLLQSIYLIRIFGIKIIFDNPYLNQLIIYFILCYGVIWATICPNYLDINTHFGFYFNNQLTAGAIIFFIFYLLFTSYITYITINQADYKQKKLIINGVLSMKKVLILGATGSIGKLTIDVIDHLQTQYSIVGCSYGKNVDLMKNIYDEHEYIQYVYSPITNELNNVYSYDELIKQAKPDIIVNAISGIAGVEATFIALENKIPLALANKESLVCAGSLILDIAKKNNISIYPIDSEHASLKSLIDAYSNDELKEMMITCSGGPFYNYSYDELENVTYDQAIKHPNWNMGNKISLDSATLMNKAFEIIEAYWLFNTNKFKPILHKESIVHALVTLKNNATIMFTSVPDMRLSIQLAITQKNEQIPIVNELSLQKRTLTFDELDADKWISLKIPSLYIQKYADTTFGTIITQLDEIAIEKFANNQLKFTEIVPFIMENYQKFPIEKLRDFNQIKNLINQIKEMYSN